MNNTAKKATLWGLFGNIVLFILKIFVGIVYNSISVISDSINSLTDIITSVILFISVKVSAKRADEGHPFGHHRAEPIAGLIVAILMGILGFEIIKAAVDRLIIGGGMIKGVAPMMVMGFTLILKSYLYVHTKKANKGINSPALLATAIDHRNDVLISIGVLIGLGGAYLGYVFLDPIVGLIIGLWIIYSGYNVGVDNVRFLMGSAPSPELMEKIKKISLGVKDVKGLNDVRAHYVGVLLQVEVHIEVSRKLTIYRAHHIGDNVQSKVENLEEVDRAFVHIDPVK